MSSKSDVRRNEDGSIDIAFYKRRAQRIMREACKARAELMHSIFVSALARLRGLPRSVLRKAAGGLRELAGARRKEYACTRAPRAAGELTKLPAASRPSDGQPASSRLQAGR